MLRKRGRWTILEDTDAMLVRFNCRKCLKEFQKEGRWLKKNHIFGCPGCGETFSFNDEQLHRLFSENIKDVGDVLKRMRDELL